MEINKLINKKFNTDRGYLYIIDLIKSIFPTFKINSDNLENLKIEKMSSDEFLKDGCVGVYYVETNTIKLFTNFSMFGEKITDEEFIDTFIHELVHAITSRVDFKQNIIFEGLNMRKINGQSSYLVAINEGITQMIVNILLNRKSDAYPFHTLIAFQIADIIGIDKLIELYSTNNVNLFVAEILKIDPNFEINNFVIMNYIVYECLTGKKIVGAEAIGTDIQKFLIDLSLKREDINKIYKFYDLMIDENKANEIMMNSPNGAENLEECCLKGIDKLSDYYLDKIKKINGEGLKV